MRLAANNKMTTRQVRMADVTVSAVAQLIRTCGDREPWIVAIAVVFVAAAGKEQRLELARPVDDPRQAGRKHVEERADAAEQENRGERHPDDLRDGIDRQIGRSLQHSRRYARASELLARGTLGTARYL